MTTAVTEKRSCANGFEIDAFEHRNDLMWKPGKAAWIKRAARRRERHQADNALRRGEWD